MSTIKAGTTSTTAYQVEADTTGNLVFQTGSASITAATMTATGNLGLGVTPSSWDSGKVVEINQLGTAVWGNGVNNLWITSNAYYNGGNFKYGTGGGNLANAYQMVVGQHRWYLAPAGTNAGDTISFTQAMTLDASGQLMVGTTTPATNTLVTLSNTNSAKLNLQGGSTQNGMVLASTGGSSTYYLGCGSGLLGGDAGVIILDVENNRPVFYVNQTSGELRTTAPTYNTFHVNGSERARITSGGAFLLNKTTLNVSADGVELGNGGGGYIATSRSSDTALFVNRNVNDGTLVDFQQAGTSEGSISVSGNTVSYNAFAGSHWSQLQDGSKPDILRGTVMESINELCEWPDETNERLPKSKISDTAGSKKVYGVFMAWDNDWTATNDMYITAVGAFICRVNGSVTVQEGDLLESNGDGTARVQADDIIRSSTIGKVTSTVKTHEYDDGSYCVPTVLYCG